MSERHFTATARPNPKHQQPTRRVDMPEPGWFKMKLVRGGPMVAAQIVHAPPTDPETGQPQEERSWCWSGIINGEPDPNPTPEPSERTMRIWTSGARIAEAEFRFLLADRQWAAQHATHLPEANPTRRVDFSMIDPRDLF